MGTLRFILALAVACGHNGIDAMLPGSRAVQIFYMISGFLMALILNGKYPDSAAGNRVFWVNRATKIFVPYFAILFPSILICLLWKAATGNAVLLQPWFNSAPTMTWTTWAFAILTNLFIVGQEWSFLLVERGGSLFFSWQAFAEPPNASKYLIVVPSWTLSLELMFYALAPFILRRHILVIAALAYASSFLRFQAYHFGYFSEATNYRFFPFELSLFLYGAVCFRLGKLLIPSNPLVTDGVAIGAILLMIIRPRYYVVSQYELYCIVGILLPALFDVSSRYRWDRVVGDLSYPLYLVHWPIAAFVGATAAHGRISAALSVVASIIAAVVLDGYLVIPLDRWRQVRARAAEAKAFPPHAELLKAPA